MEGREIINMSIKKYVAIAIAVSVVAPSLPGCATMFHGSTQQVAIRSNVPGTELYANEAYVGKDNGVTTFRKSQNYVITARKAGCDTTTVPVSKSFDATTLLGILVDCGIVSVLLVDGAATGAWNQFDQTSYVVDPRCVYGDGQSGSAVPAASAVPSVGSPELHPTQASLPAEAQLRNAEREFRAGRLSLEEFLQLKHVLQQ